MRCAKKSCEQVCFYCEEPLEGRRHEHDHLGIARRHGGTDTVPICMECHTLKDRTPLRQWPLAMTLAAFKECGPLGRILLAKAVDIAHDSIAEQDREAS